MGDNATLRAGLVTRITFMDGLGVVVSLFWHGQCGFFT